MHTENQLPRLPRTALIVMNPVWWCGGGFPTDNNTTLGWIELTYAVANIVWNIYIYPWFNSLCISGIACLIVCLCSCKVHCKHLHGIAAVWLIILLKFIKSLCPKDMLFQSIKSLDLPKKILKYMKEICLVLFSIISFFKC